MAHEGKRVKQGDKLEIPADCFNTWQKTSQTVRRLTRSPSSSLQPPTSGLPTTLIKNDSGADRSRFDVLAIGPTVSASAITPLHNLLAYCNQPIPTGHAPATHYGPIAVLAEPIADGSIGRAWFTGPCPVRLDMTPTYAAYCDRARFDGSDLTQLVPAEYGPAELLSIEIDGTGQYWATVLLNQGRAQPVHFELKTTFTSGQATAYARYPSGAGSWTTDTSEEFTVHDTRGDRVGRARISDALHGSRGIALLWPEEAVFEIFDFQELAREITWSADVDFDYSAYFAATVIDHWDGLHPDPTGAGITIYQPGGVALAMFHGLAGAGGIARRGDDGKYRITQQHC